jgi:glycosyltransferase domain-containing protein
LNYYRSTNYKHWILIGDSSNSEHIEITKKALHQFEGKLHIVYREYPGLNDAECLRQLIELASTPYAVYIADDDFLVPNGLDQSIKFLENHQDYIATHGIGINFRLRSPGPYGKFLNCSPYPLPSIEANIASQRIKDHLKNYSVTLFCVHRTEDWKRIFHGDILEGNKTFRSELLPCCLSVIYGKVKQLNCLYLIRQNHSARYLFPNINDWIRSPEWQSSYKFFRDYLAEKLSKEDTISLPEATTIIEEAFTTYLNTYNNTYTRLRNAVQHIPGMKYGVQITRYISSHRSGEFSLPTLLTDSSSYHHDFMPMYQIVTTPNKNK